MIEFVDIIATEDGRIHRVFAMRLTNGRIFDNGLLFKNSWLLFSLLFSGNFFGEQGLDGGAQRPDRGISPVPPLRKTLMIS